MSKSTPKRVDPWHYSFETQWPEPGKWRESSKRFDTVEEAVSAMVEWVLACHENGMVVAVKLSYPMRKP